MAILSLFLSPVSLTPIIMAAFDIDDLSVDHTCGSIFICDHNETSYTLMICNNGAMNDRDNVEHLTASLSDHFSEIDDVIMADGSSKIDGMMIDTDHKTITSTDIYGAERAFDLFDDILMGVRLNVTSIKVAVQIE